MKWVGVVLAASALACMTPPVVAGVHVSGQGDVGFVMGPTILETYVIYGVARSAGVWGEVLAGAKACAVRGDRLYAQATTDRDGRFALRARADAPSDLADAAYVVDDALHQTPRDGEVVVHNPVAIRHHAHYPVEVFIEHEGFWTARRKVEVPRNLKSDPIEVLLLPLATPPVAAASTAGAPPREYELPPACTRGD